MNRGRDGVEHCPTKHQLRVCLIQDLPAISKHILPGSFRKEFQKRKEYRHTEYWK